jgi:uncharacterized protein
MHQSNNNQHMPFGIDEIDFEKIKQIFADEKAIEKIILFGSRAKGNFKSGSDIDLAVIGKEINFQKIIAFKTKLEELNLPMEVDLQNYSTIQSEELKQHIERVGIEILKR